MEDKCISSHHLSLWAANLVTNMSANAIAQTISLTCLYLRGHFELTESLYDLLAPLLGTRHQHPSLGIQLFINNSNVINNSCEATHLCLCEPSITLDCTIKTHWRNELKYFTEKTNYFCFHLNAVTSNHIMNTWNSPHHGHWLRVVFVR